ncbi:MAG: hypothetical protein NTZ74_06845 [Chloroflexi bacterium]|nr:hypothetical protein [Chloroflexota bacterium]
MKKIKSVFLSTLIALITASLVTTLVFAVTSVSEANLYHYNGTVSSPTTYSSSGCAGSSCRYLTQSSSASVYRWAYLTSRKYYWYAYCPTIGVAAANYGVTGESWTTVMNQANTSNQGSYVYLGYSDNSASEAPFTSNACVSGYSCSSLRVYWDNMGYNPYP